MAIALSLLQCVSNAEETYKRSFYNELFSYKGGKGPESERDPTLPITEAEAAMVRGKGLNPSEGIAYVQHCWKRIGIVRAIGYQKQEQWIPTLIEKVHEIRWPKSSIEHIEVVSPCVWALAQIGDPAVEPILKAIGESDNLAQRQLLFRALEGIRGEDGAIQLIEERDIKLKRANDAPSRPSKRGSHSAAHPDAGGASASENSNAIQLNAPANSRGWIVWVVLLLLFAIAIASMRWLTNRSS